MNLPPALKRRLRFLVGFATPLSFSFSTGHFRSAMGSRAVDQKGQPLPWYTYPAIYYLSQLDFSSADVLEFGGGQSTLWWDQRARSVTTLESSPTFLAQLEPKVSPRVALHRVGSPADSARSIEGRMFDILIVDDGSGIGPSGRSTNALTAFAHAKPDGLIIVDNADAPPSAPIATEAAARGWHRIDFIGFAPASFRQYATSIYFKDPTRLKPQAPPRVAGI